MSLSAWIALAVVVACLVFLAQGRRSPELVMMGGLVALLVTGILTPGQALAGFANEGMITVAAMYVVAAGLRETGAIELVVRYLFGRANHVRHAQLKVMLPTLGISAFLNNTPVVASFIPAVLAWAKRHGIAPSKLLIPLSYAAILGGTCTLIGTSTNLVVNGLWLSEGGPGLGMFDLAWVGVPVALTGILYILVVGPRLLPEHKAEKGVFDNPREYTVEMQVDPKGPLVEQTILEAGLRHLGRLFLVEIVREGRVVPAVNSEERLRPNDRLVFAGDVSAIVDLQRVRGLLPALSEDRALEQQVPERRLVEVVVSPRCPLINKSLRESRFHTYYGATVIAVAREGKRVTGGLGDMELRAADTLLLEARPVWVERHRYSPDFLLVSSVEGSEAPRYERSLFAWLILAGIVGTATFGLLDMLTAALLGAGLMLLSGCVSGAMARKSIDTQVLVVIACSFALGKGLQVTGAAQTLTEYLLALPGDRPWLVLLLTYLITSLLTSVITNNAAAVVMFPIVVAMAESLGVSPVPFIITIMMAASASFATPIGYQTNLMVMGPGGYRFADFIRIGLPLNFLLACITVLVIPRVWPF
jgi:di/tricarboxylate transporter